MKTSESRNFKAVTDHEQAQVRRVVGESGPFKTTETQREDENTEVRLKMSF
jgi:hypothetical protein